MLKKVLLCIFIIILISPSVSAVNIFGRVDGINSCFQNMNSTMNSLLMQLIYFTNTTRVDINSQISELNGHLSALESNVANFSDSASGMKNTIKEIESFKLIAFCAIVSIISLAIAFLVIFIVSMYIILKKMEGNRYDQDKPRDIDKKNEG
jgi:predicted PurR-regulated permease PerM